MRTHKFRLYDSPTAPETKALQVQGLAVPTGAERVRALLHGLMFRNFPPGPAGAFEVWVDRGTVDREKLRGVLQPEHSAPTLVLHEVDPFPYEKGYPEQLGQVPADAFPVWSAAIEPTLAALRCWWNETSTVSFRRPEPRR